MASFVLTDTSVYAGALDASCFSNSVALEASRDIVDATTFCSGGWRSPIAGLQTWTATLGGPQDLAASTASTTYTPDEWHALTIGTSWPLAFVPQGAAEGSIAYFSEGMLAAYSPVGGAVGDLGAHTTQWSIGTTYPLVRGVLATKATVTATGSGTGHQLGAVAADQKVYCAVHTLTRGGTGSITCTLQSDDNAGFTTSTTRATFGAISSRFAYITSVAGAITDTYWRIGYSVSGGSPSFQLRGMIGIQ